MNIEKKFSMFISSRTTDRTIIDRLEERLAETIGNLIVMGK